MSKLISQTPIDYKAGLQVIVSDTTVPPDNPQKRSYRLPIDTIPSVGRQWDVTPNVVEDYTPDLEITDTYFVDNTNNLLALNNDTPVVSVQGSPIFRHGAAKTNINLGLLADGDVWHVSLALAELPPTNQYGLAHLILASSTLDASELPTLGLNTLLNQPLHQYIFGIGTQTAVSNDTTDYSVGMFGSVHNPSTNTFTYDNVNSTSNYPNHAVAVGETAVMIITRHGGALSFAVANKDAGGIYDIRDVKTFGSDADPTPFSDLTLYVYLGSINLGGGYWLPQVQLSVTEGLSTYNVDGTRYGVGSSQGDWDSVFTTVPHRPSGDLITPTVFPIDVRVGEALNVHVDAAYTGSVQPSAYGKSLQNKQLVLVTNTTPNHQSFERIVLSSEFDMLSAQVTQLSSGGASVGEIVVYVNDTIANPDELEGGINTYVTFDAAYESLITLPKYIRKRIVFDDRQHDAQSIEQILISPPNDNLTKVYLLRANNIVCSTYTAFMGGEWPTFMNGVNGPNRPSYNANAQLRLGFLMDGCHVEDFWGLMDASMYNGSDAVPLFRLDEQVSTPTSPLLQAPLLIGDGGYVWGGWEGLNTQNGGRIAMDGNSYLYMTFAEQNTQYAPLSITTGPKSKIELGGGVPTYYSGWLVEVYRPHNGPVIRYVTAGLEPVTHEYLFDDLKDTGFRLDDAVIIRSYSDFNYDSIYSSEDGASIMLPAANTTFIVIGQVDLYGATLKPNPTQKFTYNFYGLVEAELSSSARPVFTDSESRYANFFLRDVDVRNSGDANLNANLRRGIDTAYSSWTIQNCNVNARGGIGLRDEAILQPVGDIRHSLNNVMIDHLYSQVEDHSAVQSRGSVDMRNVRVKGHTGSNVVMDLSTTDGVASVNIDGFEVDYSNIPQRAVFRINTQAPTIDGAITVKGFTAVPNANTQGGYVPFCLFETESDPRYPYSFYPRIRTDEAGDWGAYQYYGGDVAIGITQQNVAYTVPLPGQNATFDTNCFTLANGQFMRGLGVDKLYMVRIRAHFVASQANTIIGVSITASSGAGGREQKVRTYSNALMGDIDVSIPFHHAQGGMTMVVKNLTHALDVVLSDIDITITEV